jgi:hypothetical protein
VVEENYQTTDKLQLSQPRFKPSIFYERRGIHKKRPRLAVNRRVKPPDHALRCAVNNYKRGNMDIVFTTFKQFISDLVLGTYCISVAK